MITLIRIDAVTLYSNDYGMKLYVYKKINNEPLYRYMLIYRKIQFKNEQLDRLIIMLEQNNN